MPTTILRNASALINTTKQMDVPMLSPCLPLGGSTVPEFSLFPAVHSRSASEKKQA